MQARAGSSDGKVVVAITTFSASGDVGAFVRTLVERRLVACANVFGGVKSTYRWKGEITVDDEQLVVMKTTQRSIPALKKAVLELHPYDVPELIVLDVRDGLDAYLRWVAGETVLAGP